MSYKSKLDIYYKCIQDNLCNIIFSKVILNDLVEIFLNL